MFVLFFSSRRRHTRYWRDWSSDVCSSDLDAHTATHSLVATPSVTANGRASAHLYPVDSSLGGPTAGESRNARQINAQESILRGRQRVVEGESGDLGGARLIIKTTNGL